MTRFLACLLVSLTWAEGAEPQRIASFSPAATRILCDLGVGDRIVAATRWCEIPEGSAAARSCDAFEPELEALLRLRPDAVIVPRLANPLLAGRLRDAGMRVELLAAESPESPVTDIRSLGALTGKDARASELIAQRVELRQPSKRKVLIVWSGVSAGPNSYLAWVIKAAGAQPVPTRGTWPEWDPESIALNNPDVVLYLETKGPPTPRVSSSRLEEWRSRPGLRTTVSATKGYIFELAPGTRWLPASGLPEAARELSLLLDNCK